MTTKTRPKASMPRVQRKLDGAVSTQIGLRLMPDELEQVKEIANREQRSMAFVCRLAVLRALSDYQKTGRID